MSESNNLLRADALSRPHFPESANSLAELPAFAIGSKRGAYVIDETRASRPTQASGVFQVGSGAPYVMSASILYGTAPQSADGSRRVPTMRTDSWPPWGVSVSPGNTVPATVGESSDFASATSSCGDRHPCGSTCSQEVEVTDESHLQSTAEEAIREGSALVNRELYFAMDKVTPKCADSTCDCTDIFTTPDPPTCTDVGKVVVLGQPTVDPNKPGKIIVPYKTGYTAVCTAHGTVSGKCTWESKGCI